MKTFLSSQVKRACDSVLARLPFHRTQSTSTPSRPSNVFASILSPFETYVVSFQSLLIWEQPYLSAASFVLVNCLFWLAVSWNRRFISIVACGMLIIFLYKTWVNQIWPEIRVPPSEDEENEEEWTPVHPQVLSVPELSHYINDVWGKMVIVYKDSMKLRETSHGLFCFLGCTACLLLAFLGYMVPGVVLVYSLVLGVSLGPGIVLHLIPSTIYDQLAGLFMEESEPPSKARTNADTDSDLDEFLPETSAAVLRQLSLPQESSVGAAKVSLSVCEEKDEEEEEEDHHVTAMRELGMDNLVCESEESSLFSGLGGFPSVEEENESDIENEDEEEVAIPEDKTPAAKEGSSNIRFVSTHFREDSSESDSDAAFTEGLSFTTPKEAKEAGEYKPEVSSKTEGQDKKRAETAPSLSDSDEELMDFEILEETDIS